MGLRVHLGPQMVHMKDDVAWCQQSYSRVRGRAARPLTGGTAQQDTLRNASEEFQSKTPQDMRSETISKRECQRQNWSEVRNGFTIVIFPFSGLTNGSWCWRIWGGLLRTCCCHFTAKGRHLVSRICHLDVTASYFVQRGKGKGSGTCSTEEASK